jgi:glucosamine-6-phosphate deaminase
MGVAAAARVHAEILRIVSERGSARMVMACAPSQDDYYAALIPLVHSEADVWKKVDIFHMDEYVGLTADSPQSFRNYLKEHFLSHVKVASFNPIGGEADPSEESVRYEALLSAAPIDVISMGIGENGHIAFNDPPVADFNDSHLIKKVELDGICRQQQVNDGCFPTLDEVPTHALSLTLPVFANAGMLVCIVPGVRKAEAVKNTLLGPVGTACPATLLRGHANSFLYLDADSASLLES